MATSFAADVAPLFRPKDIACMRGHGVLLDDYGYMSNAAGDADYEDHANARRVHCFVRPEGCTPRMPIRGPYWSEEQLSLYEAWMAEGFAP